jgi:aerobic-type carbon monoxide dehydrogenase small subunit (CoxS/CutS family)
VGAHEVTLCVNGRVHQAQLELNTTLLMALRDLGYTDVKNGCEQGECGACAVLLDGEPVNSCMVLAWQADGAQITTNAGLGTLEHPHPIQEAFADAGAVQCGFCTSGMIVSTKALLDRNPDPTEEEIRDALSGNLCRCTGYGQIVEAVRLAARRLRDLPLWPASSLREAGGESDSGNRILLSDDESQAGGDG